MTSPAAMGMLPLAYGLGTGAQMVRPLAIAAVGTLAIAVLLSQVAILVGYYIPMRLISVEGPAFEREIAPTIMHARERVRVG